MSSFENVDIPTLRNAIQQIHEMAGLAKPIVQDFNDYAGKLTRQSKALKGDMVVFNAALDDVLKNGKICIALDTVLDRMSQQGPPSALTGIEKTWALDRIVDLQLSLFETMQVIVRAVPKRHKLRRQALKVLSRMATQTILGGVN